MSARVAPDPNIANTQNVANSVLSGPNDVPIELQTDLGQIPAMSEASRATPATAVAGTGASAGKIATYTTIGVFTFLVLAGVGIGTGVGLTRSTSTTVRTTVTTATTATTTSATITTTTSATTTTTTSATTTTTTSATTTTSSTSSTSTSTSTSSSTSSTSTSTSTSSSTSSTSTSTSTSSSTSSTSSTSTSTTSTTATTTTTGIPCINMQWNMTGVTVAGTGTAGSSANQLSQPWNLFVDSNRNLYIADAANHRIQFWTNGASSGTTIAGVSGSSGGTASTLNMPSDVFVDSNNNMYVADRNNNRIQLFRNATSPGITVSTGWGGTGSFRGVQMAPNGFIYGADTSNHALWRNNTVPLGYTGGGGGSNQLNGPQGITVDTTINVGYVYIANANQHTIVQWVPGTTGTSTIVAGTNGVLGSSNSTMAYPVAVRIDPLGNLFVVDNNNHRVQLYCRYPTVSSTARTVVGTGVLGATATTLNYPSGLALDSDLNIYVADNANHRIQRFTRIA